MNCYTSADAVAYVLRFLIDGWAGAAGRGDK